MDQNTTKPRNTNRENNSSDTLSYSTYNSYPYHGLYNMGNNYAEQYESCEERGSWRKLYDHQSGYWYYQNLWTSTTQWEEPEGWESWPSKEQEEIEDTSAASKFRRTCEDIDKKNCEYIKRPAKRQVDPEEAKKIHWRPEGANEYNIWYDKYIGEHWKGAKNDGRRICTHWIFPGKWLLVRV